MLKRAFDLAVATAALVLLAPLFIILALAIKASGPGPVFFVQRRLGFRQREFPCLKFRTMAVNADRLLTEHLRDDPEAAEEWRLNQKLKDDPRITLIGGLLRRTSLDELPQLLNVVAGHMSLVGPRPIVRQEVARYGDKFAFYAAGRPGITGAWQVSGRSDTTYSRRVHLDVKYMRNWSIRRDLAILFATIEIVVAQRGSY